jgi:hypothetical protein
MSGYFFMLLYLKKLENKLQIIYFLTNCFILTIFYVMQLIVRCFRMFHNFSFSIFSIKLYSARKTSLFNLSKCVLKILLVLVHGRLKFFPNFHQPAAVKNGQLAIRVQLLPKTEKRKRIK